MSITFRKATAADLDAIAAIYESVHDEEAAGRATIGWVRGIYPTRETAEEALAEGDMYVETDDGRIVAAARINQYQGPEYENAVWSFDAPPEQTLLLHTLAVLPALGRRGYGEAFVRYYEQCARERNCPFLRMDTNARNARARQLYQKLGYTEACITPTSFNGIDSVNLVCLDKRI